MEEKILKLMKNLEITREEAIELIAEDEEIDRMTVKQAESDLTADQKKASKKARGVARKPAETPTKRTRKADNEKSFLVSVLLEAIGKTADVDNIEVANAEREFTFTHEGRKFKVVLSAPRS